MIYGHIGNRKMRQQKHAKLVPFEIHFFFIIFINNFGACGGPVASLDFVLVESDLEIAGIDSARRDLSIGGVSASESGV